MNAPLLLLIVLLVVFLVFFTKNIHLFYPVRAMSKDKIVHVYYDGIYNRVATISGNLVNGVVIYGALLLPISYRGSFYCVGWLEDGRKILLLRDRRHYLLAIWAEIVRYVFNTPEFEDPSIEGNYKA